MVKYMNIFKLILLNIFVFFSFVSNAIGNEFKNSNNIVNTDTKYLYTFLKKDNNPTLFVDRTVYKKDKDIIYPDNDHSYHGDDIYYHLEVNVNNNILNVDPAISVEDNYSVYPFIKDNEIIMQLVPYNMSRILIIPLWFSNEAYLHAVFRFTSKLIIPKKLIHDINFECITFSNSFLFAPSVKNEKIGNVIVKLGNKIIDTTPLIAGNTVDTSGLQISTVFDVFSVLLHVFFDQR